MPDVVSARHLARIGGGLLYAATSNVPWATLLARTVDVDVKACARCAGKLEVRAVVTDHAIASRMRPSPSRPWLSAASFGRATRRVEPRGLARSAQELVVQVDEVLALCPDALYRDDGGRPMRTIGLFVAAGALLVALVPLTACSSDDAAAPAPLPPADAGPEGDAADVSPSANKSGRRLVVRNYEAADGTVALADMFDKELGVPCVPRKMGGETQFRCVPDVGLAIYGGRYSDPSCKDALPLALPGACENAKFAVTGPRSPCEGIDVYPVTGTTTDVYASTTEGCAKVKPEDLGVPFRSLGAKLEPSKFVAFTVEEVQLTPELSVEVLQGEDGSRIVATVAPRRWNNGPARLVDKKRSAACAPQLATDGAARCLPFAGFETSTLGTFADASCQTPLGSRSECKQPGKATEPTLFANYVPPTGPLACDAETNLAVQSAVAIHKLVPSVDGSTYRRNGSGGCDALDKSDPAEVPSKGEEIPASTFPKLDFGKVAGGKRLTVIGATVGGTLVEQRRFRDNELGLDCSFVVAADGVLRCLPVAMFGSSVFVDAGCKTRALVAFPSAEACNAPIYAQFGSPELTCGDEKTKVFKVGPKVATPKDVYDGDPSSCTASPAQAGGAYPLLEEAPPSTFLEAKIVER